MDLNEIAVFVKVVEAGTFSQAARVLGMPVSTVSTKVAMLESRLGVTLIQRTTRKLHVTPAGQAYYNRCADGLEAIRGAESEITAQQNEPHGELRVTAPVELGSSLLPPIVLEFTRRYPKLNLELVLSDQTIDLVRDGVDLGLRTGELKDSSLIAKRLGQIYFALYASPAYLKSAPKIHAPKDLREHSCLVFTPLRGEKLKLAGPKGSVALPVEGRMTINDFNTIKALALAGAGPALLPGYLCYPEVKAGKLVRILPEWRSNSRPVHFVYPEQRFVAPKLSAFIAFAAEPIKSRLQEYAG